MSEIEFPLGHPEIRCGNYSCRNLLNKLKRKNEKFIGICQVHVLPPDNLFIPCLAHKMNGKLLFCSCQTYASNGLIQRSSCTHNDMERSLIDVYTSVDIERVLSIGYLILEYREIWHCTKRGGKIFPDFILNMVRQKMECSGFPIDCNSEESKQENTLNLKEHCSINLELSDVRKDSAGRYLNKIMANLVCGKWVQNPAGQSSVHLCGMIRDYHDKLLTGRVKRVSLISEKTLQEELKNYRQIDGENRESENIRSGLGGRNTIVEAFVMAATRDLMFHHYLSKLHPDQLWYTDMDSVIIYEDARNDSHVKLPTSDMLGDLKDDYGE